MCAALRCAVPCCALTRLQDVNTRYVDIGPVNKVINMLACWMEDPNGEAFRRHLPRIHDYLWVAEDGLKMQGYNGSQLWDTSFAVQVGGKPGAVGWWSWDLGRPYGWTTWCAAVMGTAYSSLVCCAVVVVQMGWVMPMWNERALPACGDSHLPWY